MLFKHWQIYFKKWWISCSVTQYSIYILLLYKIFCLEFSFHLAVTGKVVKGIFWYWIFSVLKNWRLSSFFHQIDLQDTSEFLDCKGSLSLWGKMMQTTLELIFNSSFTFSIPAWIVFIALIFACCVLYWDKNLSRLRVRGHYIFFSETTNKLMKRLCVYIFTIIIKLSNISDEWKTKTYWYYSQLFWS